MSRGGGLDLKESRVLEFMGQTDCLWEACPSYPQASEASRDPEVVGGICSVHVSHSLPRSSKVGLFSNRETITAVHIPHGHIVDGP